MSLKIRLLSDLHLELHNLDNLSFKRNADIVILAGDIGDPYSDSYSKLLRILSLTHEEVLIITGNHEYYNDKTPEETDTYIQQLCNEEFDNVHFLQTNIYIYKGIKFIGCTLWTQMSDPSLYKYINDQRYITTENYDLLHKNHKQWIETELSKDKTDNKICVITHHLPLYQLIDDRYKDDPLNCFFATNININNANVWCYGHTHISNCIKICNTSFHCNPRGYSHEKSGWNVDYTFEINL